MSSAIVRHLCTTAILAGVAALPSSALPPRFDMEILPTFAGGETHATAINDVGQVTGSSGADIPGLGLHAFIWSADTGLQPLDPAGVYASSTGYAINNSGQVAARATLSTMPGYDDQTLVRYNPGSGFEHIAYLTGDYGRIMDINESGSITGYWDTYTDASYGTRAFVYTDTNGFEEIPPFDGVGASIAWDINDFNQIVGTAANGSATRAFLWDDGVMTDLGTLGGTSADAYYIDNMGVIVGWALTADGTRHAFRWTSDLGIQDIHSFANAPESEALWNVDSGWVIGTYTANDGATRQFYSFNDGPMIDMGVELSPGQDGIFKINNAGEGIGTMNAARRTAMHATYFSPTAGVLDLNDLLVEPTTFEMRHGVDVSEAGQIVVTGQFPGNAKTRSAVLTPLIDGDSDCDGDVDYDDISFFVAAIGAPQSWTARHQAAFGTDPGCHYLSNDMDHDGDVDFDDITPFVSAIGQ
jgi:probable HAF family extracellular repeat protein